MQDISKETKRTEYKSEWRRIKKDTISTTFDKSENIKDRLKDAAISAQISVSELIKRYVLDGLKRDGY